MKLTEKQIQTIKDNTCIHCGNIANENLKKWFSDKWVNIGKKDKSGKHPLVAQVVRKGDTQNVFLLLKLVV